MRSGDTEALIWHMCKGSSRAYLGCENSGPTEMLMRRCTWKKEDSGEIKLKDRESLTRIKEAPISVDKMYEMMNGWVQENKGKRIEIGIEGLEDRKIRAFCKNGERTTADIFTLLRAGISTEDNPWGKEGYKTLDGKNTSGFAASAEHEGSVELIIEREMADRVVESLGQPDTMEGTEIGSKGSTAHETGKQRASKKEEGDWTRQLEDIIRERSQKAKGWVFDRLGEMAKDSTFKKNLFKACKRGDSKCRTLGGEDWIAVNRQDEAHGRISLQTIHMITRYLKETVGRKGTTEDLIKAIDKLEAMSQRGDHPWSPKTKELFNMSRLYAKQLGSCKVRDIMILWYAWSGCAVLKMIPKNKKCPFKAHDATAFMGREPTLEELKEDHLVVVED